MNRRVAVRVALVSALLGTLINAAVNVATDVLPPRWQLGWLSLPVIVIALGLLVVVEMRWRATADPVDTVASARGELGSAVAARWQGASYGPLDPPGPMVVPWVSARWNVSPHGPVLWALGGALLAPNDPWPFSLTLAAVVALPVGIAVGVTGPPLRPARLGRRHGGNPGQVWRRLTIGIGGGAVAGLSIAPVSGIGHGSFFVMLGVLIGLGIATIGSTDPVRAHSPRSVLIADASTLLAALIFSLIVGALAAMFVFLADVQAPTWLGTGLAGFVAGAFTGDVLFRAPRAEVIRVNTRSAIAAAIGGALTGALGAATAALTHEKLHNNEPSSILWVGTAFGLWFGIAGGAVVTSWSSYQLTVTVLWLRGLAPLCLIRFLEDAHRRGVLRQAGAGYQFRHALLQDRLADTAELDQPAPSVRLSTGIVTTSNETSTPKSLTR